MTLEDRTARPASEPLFTIARTSMAVPGPGTIAADPWAPGDEMELLARLSLVETVMDSMGGPVIELGAPPVAFIPPPPETPGPRHRRKGMVRNFREWWRQESLARAAQKRAFAMAETILRSQAAQLASGYRHSAPSSDRVQDELSAISRSLEEMRGQISQLIALQRSG
jgi:hypothetical protein